MSAEDFACQACDALPGEPCEWDCIGYASHVDALDAELDGSESAPSVATPDAVDAHCLICLAVTPAAGDYLIARALTVQASKVYAAIHYRAVAQEAQR